jgi:hypothetical protein
VSSGKKLLSVYTSVLFASAGSCGQLGKLATQQQSSAPGEQLSLFLKWFRSRVHDFLN